MFSYKKCKIYHSIDFYIEIIKGFESVAHIFTLKLKKVEDDVCFIKHYTFNFIINYYLVNTNCIEDIWGENSYELWSSSVINGVLVRKPNNI
jgi:hypothetical protein